MYEYYKQTLENIKSDSLQRKIHLIKKHDKFIDMDTKTYLNLSSNDYLGLAEDKNIINSFLKTAEYSLGSASSRLLTGTSCIYNELENLLACLYKKEKALLFNSGYHANVGIMSSLLSKKDVVFSDKLNHASIIDGIKLSEAKMFRYKHLDYAHLEELLKKHRDEFRNAIIVSESLFSMDGDIANLKKLVELKNKYNALLVIDEAHAIGVYGENALGLADEQNVTQNIDLIVGTFGKALASMGAFCTGNGILIEYITNKARSFIFSTALPEINIAFTYYIITEIIPNLTHRRQHLLSTSEQLRNIINEHNLLTAGSSYIIPIIIGSNKNTIKCTNILMENGYYLLPIRHPTVALNSSRIRISLRADINFDEIKNIPEIITKNLEI